MENTTRNSVNALVALVEQGQILTAFDTYYADDVTMQENVGQVVVGKEANRQREINFVDSIADVHENKAASVVVDGDTAVINWLLEATFKDGSRLRFDQIAFQTWHNGKIVRERFIYDSATLAVLDY